MERLVAVLYLLSRARDRGCPVDRLTAVGRYGGEPSGQRDQLARDLGHLRTMGWDIDNIGADGDAAVYRLTARDNRLWLQFTPAERVELYRCARIARLRDVAAHLRAGAPPSVPPSTEPEELAIEHPRVAPGLTAVLAAIEGGCRLRFRYFGQPRDVVPRRAVNRAGAWYLVAVDGAAVKTYRVDRMSEVAVGPSAGRLAPTSVPEPRLDPLTWVREDPVDVRIATTRDYRPQVVAMLGPPLLDEVDGARLVLTIRTSDTLVLLQRICQLGERVTLLGPDSLRARLRDHLLAVAGGA